MRNVNEIRLCADIRCSLPFIPKYKNERKRQIYCSYRCNQKSYRYRHKRSYDTEKHRIHCREHRRMVRNKAIMLLGSKCYFYDKFCKGPLEIDHKYGAKRIRINGKKRSNNTLSPWKVCQDPSKFLLLCKRHNGIKDDIEFDILPDILCSMMTKLNMEV